MFCLLLQQFIPHHRKLKGKTCPEEANNLLYMFASGDYWTESHIIHALFFSIEQGEEFCWYEKCRWHSMCKISRSMLEARTSHRWPRMERGTLQQIQVCFSPTCQNLQTDYFSLPTGLSKRRIFQSQWYLHCKPPKKISKSSRAA